MTTQQAFATLTGSLRQPMGKRFKFPRWAFALILAAVAVGAAFTVVTSLPSATAQSTAAPAASVAEVPAPAPLAQQAPAPQTLQLTSAQLDSLQGDLRLRIMFLGRNHVEHATPQAAEQMYQFQDAFRKDPRVDNDARIKVVPFGPVTQKANGVASVDVRIEAWDRVPAPNGRDAMDKLMLKRGATVEFTLDSQTKRIKQITNFRPH